MEKAKISHLSFPEYLISLIYSVFIFGELLQQHKTSNDMKTLVRFLRKEIRIICLHIGYNSNRSTNTLVNVL